MTSTGELDLTAADGWRLNVLDVRPERPRAIVVAGHATWVDRRTLFRDGRATLGATLAEAGFRVLLPDLRGRAKSGPTPREGADWSYDDLVRDAAAYVDLARRLEPSLPLFLVGHSLFGHVSLAHLALHPDAPVAGWVGVAVNVWGRGWEPARGRRLRKRLLAAASSGVARALGYFPARRLGLGNADDSRGFWRDFSRFARTGRWEVGGVDVQPLLARVACPALLVVSDGDTLYCHPENAIRWSAPLARREVLRVAEGTHMGLVTDPGSAPVWKAITTWIERTIEAASPEATP